jgi:(p)ppGpp synthase/HD superfamily hydrolase
MQKFNTLADAIRIAELAHFSQIDKAGLPYIEHPKRVLETVKAQGVAPYVQMAAVLHDVPEDTAFSHDVLLTLGFSEAVVNLTRLLDRGHSRALWMAQQKGKEQLAESWSELDSYEFKFAMAEWQREHAPFIDDKDEFYYRQIKADRNATIIKLADIRDNMAGWRLAYLSDETQKRLRAKYNKALAILNPRPVNHGLIDPNYVFDPYTLR